MIASLISIFVSPFILPQKYKLTSIYQLFLIREQSPRGQMKGIAIYPALVMPALVTIDLVHDTDQLVSHFKDGLTVTWIEYILYIF